jgi:plastocyanin
VVWTNRDAATHTVSGAAFESGFLVEGASFAHTFAQAGIYPFACRVHPFMQAAISVG